MSSQLAIRLLALSLLLISTRVSAQPEQESPPTIDLGAFIPEELGRNVTVDFDETPLKDVAAWIQREQGIPVVLDESALADVGIPAGEPITDQLDEAPLYLLLERLNVLGLTWVMEDDVLQITTSEKAEKRLDTRPNEMTDLLDAGGTREGLVDMIYSCTAGACEDVDGIGGTTSWLGDVLFVQQNDRVHWEVAALLQALRNPGSRTLLLEPATHVNLRELLDQPVSVEFDDTPLYHAIRMLSEQTGADIRLEATALTDVGVRTKEPVTLQLTDRKLRTVLKAILANHGLTWVLENGVMWITTQEIAGEKQQAVVFGVADLADGVDEEQALIDALQQQTDANWEDIDGIGGTLTIPVPGRLVVRQTGRALEEVTRLLALYRQSLKDSKLRPEDRIDPQEVVTRYYRMDSAMALELAGLIPLLVQPESWEPDEADEDWPRILSVSSGYQLLDGQGNVVFADPNRKQNAMAVPQAVLIIRQTRSVQDEIVELIEKVRHGDGRFRSGGLGGGGTGSGGLGGGGGFGGVMPANAGGGGGGFGSGLIGTGKP